MIIYLLSCAGNRNQSHISTNYCIIRQKTAKFSIRKGPTHQIHAVDPCPFAAKWLISGSSDKQPAQYSSSPVYSIPARTHESAFCRIPAGLQSDIRSSVLPLLQFLLHMLHRWFTGCRKFCYFWCCSGFFHGFSFSFCQNFRRLQNSSGVGLKIRNCNIVL